MNRARQPSELRWPGKRVMCRVCHHSLIPSGTPNHPACDDETGHYYARIEAA